MRHLFLIFFALIVLPAWQAEAEFGPPEKLVIETRTGQIHTFQVELAIKPNQWAQGLMNRESMAEDAGMLFIFPDVSPKSFWMKNTLIPLDMLFLNADGSIYSIHENAKPLDPTSIRSGGPVKAVLELNGGASKKLGLKPGDRILHPLLNE